MQRLIGVLILEAVVGTSRPQEAVQKSVQFNRITRALSVPSRINEDSDQVHVASGLLVRRSASMHDMMETGGDVFADLLLDENSSGNEFVSASTFGDSGPLTLSWIASAHDMSPGIDASPRVLVSLTWPEVVARLPLVLADCADLLGFVDVGEFAATLTDSAVSMAELAACVSQIDSHLPRARDLVQVLYGWFKHTPKVRLLLGAAGSDPRVLGHGLYEYPVQVQGLALTSVGSSAMFGNHQYEFSAASGGYLIQLARQFYSYKNGVYVPGGSGFRLNVESMSEQVHEYEQSQPISGFRVGETVHQLYYALQLDELRFSPEIRFLGNLPDAHFGVRGLLAPGLRTHIPWHKVSGFAKALPVAMDSPPSDWASQLSNEECIVMQAWRWTHYGGTCVEDPNYRWLIEQHHMCLGRYHKLDLAILPMLFYQLIATADSRRFDFGLLEQFFLLGQSFDLRALDRAARLRAGVVWNMVPTWFTRLREQPLVIGSLFPQSPSVGTSVSLVPFRPPSDEEQEQQHPTLIRPKAVHHAFFFLDLTELASIPFTKETHVAAFDRLAANPKYADLSRIPPNICVMFKVMEWFVNSVRQVDWLKPRAGILFVVEEWAVLFNARTLTVADVEPILALCEDPGPAPEGVFENDPLTINTHHAVFDRFEGPETQRIACSILARMHTELLNR